MHRVINWLNIIDGINSWVGKILGFMVIAITAIMMLEVILRYVFNSPTIWAGEVSQQLFMGLALVGGYTMLRNGHVRMDALYSRLSPRGKAIIDVATFIMFLLFCSMLVWQGADMAWESIKTREVRYTYFAPAVYPIKTSLAVACFLLLLQGVAKFIRDIALIMGIHPAAEGRIVSEH